MNTATWSSLIQGTPLQVVARRWSNDSDIVFLGAPGANRVFIFALAVCGVGDGGSFSYLTTLEPLGKC